MKTEPKFDVWQVVWMVVWNSYYIKRLYVKEIVIKDEGIKYNLVHDLKSDRCGINDCPEDWLHLSVLSAAYDLEEKLKDAGFIE